MVPLKPDPAGILAVCKQLNVPASETWMIGDGPQDIGAGKAAGCVTIAVPGIAERDLVVNARPDRIVASLVEVATLAVIQLGDG